MLISSFLCWVQFGGLWVYRTFFLPSYCSVTNGLFMLMLLAYAISYKTLKIKNIKVNEYNLGVTCYSLQHLLEVFANYNRFCKLYLIYTKPDSVLSNFMMVLQIELKPVALYFWTVFHCNWSYKMSEWSSVLLGPCFERWVVWGLEKLPIFVAFCCCCELQLTINYLLVCNFFRKPGNMQFRKPSTCLIHGQNFILRTLRLNKPFVTGLWVFLLLLLMLNKMCLFMRGLCLCSAEHVYLHGWRTFDNAQIECVSTESSRNM